MKKIVLLFLVNFAIASQMEGELEKAADNAPEPIDIKAIHKLVLLYGWTVLADLMVLMMHYTHKSFTPFLHGFIGILLFAATFITSVPSIIKHGFNTKHLTHYIIGVVIWGIMFFQIMIGIASMVLQWINKTRAMPIYILKKIHNYLGFALMAVCKVQVFL